MKREEKIAAFVAHIVEECEQEGLTIFEIKRLPSRLERAINNEVGKFNAENQFKRSQSNP